MIVTTAAVCTKRESTINSLRLDLCPCFLTLFHSFFCHRIASAGKEYRLTSSATQMPLPAVKASIHPNSAPIMLAVEEATSHLLSMRDVVSVNFRLVLTATADQIYFTERATFQIK